ncbi:MAG TPA: High-affinity nickel transporter [bacterium]|nr:High-affinity nickel transporter [bacterium]
MIAPLLAGILAGSVHVVSGPDHLAAVAPLAVSGRRRAWAAGVRWGLGHSLGVFVVAAVALLLRDALPLESISAWSERLVGVVLIAIGLWALRSATRNHVHVHEHEHNGLRHAHVHVHTPGTEHEEPHAHSHAHAAFGVGALHGLAGSSHLLGVLPALALPTNAAAVAYLAGYGIGSIAAMGGFALAVGRFAHRLGGDGTGLRRLLGAAGTAAIAVGAFWIVR